MNKRRSSEYSIEVDDWSPGEYINQKADSIIIRINTYKPISRGLLFFDFNYPSPTLVIMMVQAF